MTIKRSSLLYKLCMLVPTRWLHIYAIRIGHNTTEYARVNFRWRCE